MEVKILEPQGFCAGVKAAISKTLKAREDYPNKKVYVLGMLVHNNEVVKELNNKNIITLDTKNKDLKEVIKSIDKGSVIVFTAHGHDKKLDEVARENELIIIDATCPKVSTNMDKIRKFIKDNYKVIYIGVDNHPETVASLSISSNVLLYNTKLLKNNQITTKDNVVVLNQTTLNILDLKSTHEDILSHLPNAIIEDEICPTTRLRQQALSTLEDDGDLIIIVGDKMSNNSKKLFEIASNYHKDKKIVMISNVSEFDPILLNGIKKVAISSGASTPNSTISDLYNLIKNSNN